MHISGPTRLPLRARSILRGGCESFGVDVLIRGGEIHIANAIRIRKARPPVAGPYAGGCGAIRRAVPYHVKTEPNVTAVLYL